MIAHQGFHDGLAASYGLQMPQCLVVSQVLIDLIEAQFPGTLQPQDDGYDWVTADGTVVRLNVRVELCD